MAVARELLLTVQFPGDSDGAYVLALAGPRRRKELMKEGGPKGRTAAAIEIQRTWRGHRTRSKLRAILLHTTAISQKPSRENQVWSEDEAGLDLRRDACARTIQTWWKENKKTIKRRRLSSRPDRAVAMIQRAWRRYSDIKVFRFYHDLINFHSRGNPEHMLKTINPSEAKLMDKASGGFVRFRLGGTSFPPNIYYKIYTHRPVVDVCAFSPRDYTAMSERLRLPRDVHTKHSRNLATDTDKWYRRMENNGWRLASNQLENNSLQDYAITSSKKPAAFHHLKVKRREEIERARKQKRREWMVKLYSAKDPLPHSTSDDSGVNTDVRRKDGDEDVHNDVDTLLEWSTSLDYNRYMFEWQTLATSSVSDDPYTLRYHYREVVTN